LICADASAALKVADESHAVAQLASAQVCGAHPSMNIFKFPTHKAFRGVKEFQETTREVLELESRASMVKSSKKKGKLQKVKRKKQLQLTDEYADLLEVEAQFKKKEKIVAVGFTVFVPIFLVVSYSPFVPLPYMPLLGMLSLLPVAAIFTIYREEQPMARARPESLWPK
jgi:hypothetical protein